MTDTHELARALRRLARDAIPGAELVEHRRLTGGVSAQTIQVDIRTPEGKLRKFVVRQHGDADYNANPDIAMLEYTLLRALQETNVPAPAAVFVDQSAEYLPRPCLVIEYVEGEPLLGPDVAASQIREMARVLARIHSVTLPAQVIDSLPAQSQRISQMLAHEPERPDDGLSEGRIRSALRKYWQEPDEPARTLLHGDFWPGNVLWQGQEVAAIIDWEDAATGDPLADVANCRLELLWAFGDEAMQEFTAHYQMFAERRGLDDLPVWDLVAALRPAGKLSTWGLEQSVESHMRELHRGFVSHALSALRGYSSG